MITHWISIVLVLALQHVWQSALLVLVLALLLRLGGRLSAETKSRALLCAIALAAVLPLAVLLPQPGTPSAAPTTVAHAAAMLVASAPPLDAPSTMVLTEYHRGAGSNLARIGIVIWLLGLLVAGLRLCTSWHATRRLRRAARPLSRNDLNLPQPFPVSVAIGVSDQISSPMVVGCRRPCILLPRAWLDQLPDTTLIHVVRHELAHVRRGDLWIALAVSVCLAVYWWSPLLWWLRSQLDMAREMACDERAAMQADGGATDYAHALLACAGTLMSQHRSSNAFAVGIADPRSALNQRIQGLLNMNISDRTARIKTTLAACGAMVLVSVSLTLYATPRLGSTQVPTSTADADLLVAAVRAQRVDVIRQLVLNGADIDAPLSGDGTALIIAVKQHDLHIIKALIALGANANQPAHGDGNPLIAAAASGDLAAAKILIDAGADVNAIVVEDETALINASRRGHLTLVKYLVEHGADVNLEVFANGKVWRSPLNQAATDAIRHYLASKGATARKHPATISRSAVESALIGKQG